MKRPLALFGAAYFAAIFLGIYLPQQLLGAAAAFLVLPALLAALIRRIPARVRVAVPACALGLLTLLCYQRFVVAPVVAYAGGETTVTGVVMETEATSYGTEYAVIRMDTIGGTKVPGGLRIRVEPAPALWEGDIIRMTVEPEIVALDQYRFSRYADGVFLEAGKPSACERVGESTSPLFDVLRLRDSLAWDLRLQLSDSDVSEVAVAMTLGDRSWLPVDIQESFRRAGLSHVLVVSGLHLSMVVSAVYGALAILLRSRRFAAAGAAVAALGYMCLVGFTPSVVRAGCAALMLCAGRLFRRRSDGFTSMALSAMLLCVVNPYAAVDAGLLLSYSAASAVLLVGSVERRCSLRDKLQKRTRSRVALAARSLAFRVAVPAATCLATLPVLASIGSGVSLWSIPANLVAVPFTGGIVLAGLVTLLVCQLGPLAFLAEAAAFVCGLGIRILIATAATAASLPGGYFRFTGVLQTLPLLAAALLFSAGMRWKIRLPVNLLCTALLLASVYGAQYALGADVVTLSVAGTGTTPAIVLTYRGEAVVLYRSTLTRVDRVAQWLEENGSPDVVLAVYLREDVRSADIQDLQEALGAQRCVGVAKKLAEEPIRDIMIVADTQKSGTYAVMDVGGCVVCVGSGTVDFALLPHADYFIAGTPEPANLDAGTVLLLSPDVDWAGDDGVRWYVGTGDPKLLVRPGKSAILTGVMER